MNCLGLFFQIGWILCASVSNGQDNQSFLKHIRLNQAFTLNWNTATDQTGAMARNDLVLFSHTRLTLNIFKNLDAGVYYNQIWVKNFLYQSDRYFLLGPLIQWREDLKPEKWEGYLEMGYLRGNYLMHFPEPQKRTAQYYILGAGGNYFFKERLYLDIGIFNTFFPQHVEEMNDFWKIFYRIGLGYNFGLNKSSK